MSRLKICTICGHIGKSYRTTKGSFGLELFFWLLTILSMGIFAIIALPYSIWRITGRKDACSACGNVGIEIPVDTPRGQKLFREIKQN